MARGMKKVEQTGRRPSEREMQGEREREGWKNGREANMRECSGWFCPCGAAERFFPLALFLPVLGAPCTSSLSSRSPFPVPSSPSIALHAPPLSPSACPPLDLSDLIPTRLSMASALCLPSSHRVRLAFSQDAPLQVLLHQNGTETNRMWRFLLVLREQVEESLT